MSQTEQRTAEKQKNLKTEREISLQMEKLIPKMQELAESYNLRNERSPFRNVLNVATDPGSGIEVTKNYIRYQLGRSGANRMWSDTAGGNMSFAVALVKEIEALGKNAKDIVQLIGEDPTTDSGKERTQQVHLRLMQLYLGNLARYQVFLANEGGNS